MQGVEPAICGAERDFCASWRTIGGVRAAAVILVLAGALGVSEPMPAAAAPSTPRPRPSASPGAGSERATSPGVLLVFGLLGAAVLWQVQRGRRAARDYARAATTHFERSFEPPPGDEPPPSGNDVSDGGP